MKADNFAAMLAGLRVHVPMREIVEASGLSRSHLYRIERGEVPRPSHETVERLQAVQKNFPTVPHTGQKRS
jgi:transcriptional regulator with XRE-family HTH domain